MKGRRKTKVEGPELGAAPAAAAKAPVKAAEVLEYQPLSTEGRWRVERWEMLSAELEVADGKAMPLVHEALRRYARSWLVVRRLFGVMPVLVGLNSDPDDCRAWSREELADKLGISKEELKEEVNGARAVTQHALGKAAAAEEKPLAGPDWAPNEATSNAHYQGRRLTPLSDEEYLQKMGYARRMFEITVRARIPGQENERRSAAENQMEMEWFAGRVRQFEKVLLDRMSARLADQVLRNELRLRRVEDELMTLVIGSTEYDSMMKAKAELEKTYERQLKELNTAAPWFAATEREVAAKDAFSEVVKAVQEYQSRGDRKLVDGLFTSYEIQVMLRTSVQKPAPMYRMGWNLYILQSREFLWNPESQSAFRPTDLKKLDAGFQEAVRRVIAETGEKVPDLMQAGPNGEYEELVGPEAAAQ